MISEVKFADWLPDVPDYKNPGLENARNMTPSPTGYTPAYGTAPTGSTVTGTVIGAVSFERTDGTRCVACATTTDMFVIVSGTVTASGLGFGLTSDAFFNFQQFGNELWATSRSGDTYYLTDVDTDTSFSLASGNPPKADAMARIGEFLFMGNLTDIDASEAPFRLRWSRFNNPSGDWDTNVGAQSGAVDLRSDQGPIVAITGGQTGIVFQKFGISRITYTGGPNVFQKTLFEKNRGCASPLGAVVVGGTSYFISYDGFFATDGASVESISRGRIWEWFQSNANQIYISSVQAAVDWPSRCIVWSFAGNGQASRTHQLLYNWETKNWSYVDRPVDFIVVSGRDAVTLESLDASYPNLDTMVPSLDAGIFAARGRYLQCFVGTALCEFGGASLQAQFETGDFQPENGKRSFIRGVTPLITSDAQSIRVAPGKRDTLRQSVMYGASVATGSKGEAAVISDARYHRLRFTVEAGDDWSDAYGFQVDYEASGRL